MTERKTEERQVPFDKTAHRFHNALLSSIEDFRRGNDRQALDGFTNMMSDMETLIELDQYSLGEKLKLDLVVPILEELSMYVENRDIAALTDVMEYSLYPIAKELIENHGNDHSQGK